MSTAKLTNAAPHALPWPREASSEVHQVRRAITAHLREPHVDTELATMMPGLLQRLDALVGAPVRSDIAAPAPPDAARPPGDQAIHAALGRLSDHARQALSGAGPESARTPEAARSLQGMLEVLERHLGMQHEVVLRVDLGPDGVRG